MAWDQHDGCEHEWGGQGRETTRACGGAAIAGPVPLSRAVGGSGCIGRPRSVASSRSVGPVNARDYQRALGERLRAIRTQQGMSLADVEGASNGTWKSVVVGAYERGDRAITIARLERLAEFYGVPVPVLLPEASPGARGDAGEHPSIVIDLTRLPDVDPPVQEAVADEPVVAVARLAEQIRSRRQDPVGSSLTLRGDDVHRLAMVLGVTHADLVDELMLRGVLHS